MPQVTLINVDKIQENFDELYNRSDDRVVVVVKGDKKLFLVKECDTKIVKRIVKRGQKIKTALKRSLSS